MRSRKPRERDDATALLLQRGHAYWLLCLAPGLTLDGVPLLLRALPGIGALESSCEPEELTCWPVGDSTADIDIAFLLPLL